MSQVNAEFYVAYDGPALASNEMDIRELAPALLAIGKIIEEANHVLNDGRAKVIVNVKGSFEKGSFGIDLNIVQSIFSQVVDFFNSASVTAGAQILAYLGFADIDAKCMVKGVLWIIHKIAGRKIKNIETLQDGNIRLFFGDEFIDITPQVMKLLENKVIRENIEKAIKNPLENEGIDTFMIHGQNEEKGLVVKKDEARWYTCPALQEEELDDREFTEKLQIVNLPFQDDNKWRFTDGNNIFFATMEDESFLLQINNNDIAFSKGDILEAKMHKKTWIDIEGKMKSEYRILKIITHRSAAKQLKLL